MTLVTDLQSFQRRRKFPNWQPQKPGNSYKGSTATSEYQVLLRCLDFLPLELQVQNWDAEADLVPELAEASDILQRNAADEDKHNTVLKYLYDYLGKQGIGQQAQQLLDKWEALNCHPVLSMYALEMGVFFSILPTLTKFGDVYAAQVAQWINDDERVHVETGLRLMKALGLKLTSELLELIYLTNVYIYTPLGHVEAHARARRACERTVTTKDRNMLNESLPTTIAFFEQHSRQSIVY